MNRNGPVIIIEDDKDDQDILKEVFRKLDYSNEIKFFFSGDAALNYLNDNERVTPFMILSDINLPKLDGFALRSKIRMDEKLQSRCIPYLFFSTSINKKAVTEAYRINVQGFFKKENTIEELEKTIHVIFEYWKRCASPNNF
jgi:CheY-like chemotaxis protein